MTTHDLAPGRLAATRRPFRALRFLVAAACLGLAFPALAQEAVPAGIDVETLSSAVLAAGQPTSTGDRALYLAGDLAARANPGPVDGSAAPSSGVQNLLKRALALLGTPYRWGGTETNGFDCSGLVGYVFKTALGVELPRVSREMASSGQRIDRSALTAGDIVFFGRGRKGIDHVGIYVGNGQFVHAPRTGKDVMVSQLDSAYWSRHYVQARRIAGI